MKIVIILSLILSILHSILFWGNDFGISIPIFTITSIIILIYILNKNNKIKKPKAILWLIPIMLISMTYCIFNNFIFNILNIIALIILIGIMTIEITRTNTKTNEYFEKFIQVILGPIESFGEIIKEIKEIKKIIKPKKEKKENEQIKNIIKKVLISLPIVIIVILLLTSADKVFGSIFTNMGTYIQNILKDSQIIYLILQIIVIGFLFIYFASYIFNLIKDNTTYTYEKKENLEKNSKGINIENLTITTILIILNIIYLIFSVIQFQYLFSGAGIKNDFNFASYARQGFFQLVVVSFINFAIILIANINKTKISKKQENIKRTLEIILILFTIVIIISSFMRMYMYEQDFGYTHLRLLVYAILITEVISIIPILIYILGQKINILKSLTIIIVTMYIGLNYINIDNLIAKNNIDRYFSSNEEKRKIDISYLINSTGTDGISQITRLLDSKNESIELTVKRYIEDIQNYYKNKQYKWQEYNMSKEQIKKIQGENRNENIR